MFIIYKLQQKSKPEMRFELSIVKLKYNLFDIIPGIIFLPVTN